MTSKTYNIFISHSWKYDDHYQKIVNFLNSDKTFSWRDYSIPLSDPLHTNGTDKDLREAIENKIRYSSIVVLLAGVYSSYSKWIDKEIDIAKKLNTPIVAVKLWGAERSADKAVESATLSVNWQASSIIDAIKKHG